MTEYRVFYNFSSKGRIDIRMPSNNAINAAINLIPNTGSSEDITCNDAKNGIICDDAISGYTFHFVVIVKKSSLLVTLKYKLFYHFAAWEHHCLSILILIWLMISLFRAYY